MSVCGYFLCCFWILRSVCGEQAADRIPGPRLVGSSLEAVGGVEVDALVGLSAADFQRVPGACLPVPVDLPAQAGARHQGVPAGSVSPAGYGLPGSPGAGVRVPAGDVPYIGHAQLRQQDLAVAQPADGFKSDAHGDAP